MSRSGHLPDTDLEVSLAGLFFIASGTRPPPKHEDLLRRLEEAAPDDRWRILFALVLDLTRKLAYAYSATNALTEDLAARRDTDLANDSSIRVLARMIIAQEERLRRYEDAGDYTGYLGELISILDRELKTEPISENRERLLQSFAEVL